MSFLHSKSLEATKSELDLFEINPTLTAIEDSRWIFYLPKAPIARNTPIEFVVPGSGDEYSDLSLSYLYVKTKIVKNDGSDLLDADTDIAFSNNALHSLFSQVDVFLNNVHVSDSACNYAYRAYIESLLSYGSDAKRSHLTAALFYKDDAGELDERQGNSGFNARRQFTEKSKEVELLGPIFADVFNMDKYLLNGVELKIKLVPSSQAFALMSGKLQVRNFGSCSAYS